ncbi:uncharacterized protein C8R40DRAFT_1169626 [Lentinula edodes]|uniref:uncharacterized protein n=1 Tax=Lentinula edodes TaxID=5353 RepID=UPI001BF746F4|nr:uncharacterized protein C8R40DRAFT_1169626 [Lentinula edodes]KAF8827261.1 hypothetical protein HHX47_DHR5000802 [Lentinula edodes]KAH7876516.1 hypothetical protein C8R40DRAFT_1169626 [Lentinula edodes]
MAPSFSSRLLCIYLFLIQLLGIPAIANPLALTPPAIALLARNHEFQFPSVDIKVWYGKDATGKEARLYFGDIGFGLDARQQPKEFNLGNNDESSLPGDLHELGRATFWEQREKRKLVPTIRLYFRALKNLINIDHEAPYSGYLNALMMLLEEGAAESTNMFSLGVAGEKWTKEVYPDLSRREREHKG